MWSSNGLSGKISLLKPPVRIKDQPGVMGDPVGLFIQFQVLVQEQIRVLLSFCSNK
jgi:hypothetical protein